MSVIAAILIISGLAFLFVSSLGLIRLPDFYSRNHAAGKSQTLGTVLILAGIAIHIGWDINALKLLIIFIFFAVANPTATHAIARAAYRAGLEPWTLKNPREGSDIDTRGSDPDSTPTESGHE